jgi:SAM-dependent methyltransferase
MSAMNYHLRQRGRAGIDFKNALMIGMGGLQARADRAVEAAGLDDASLADDLDARHRQIAPVLAADPAFRALVNVRKYALRFHGDTAASAFDEVRAEIEPMLKSLQQGGSTLTPAGENFRPPAYWEGLDFHGTTGGWDGHDYMGFVHGELIFFRQLAANVDLLEQRRSAVRALGDRRYARILELGCSSGPFTRVLAEMQPQAEIHACDLSLRQLEQAQRNGNALGAAWRLFQAAAESTGMPDEHFDLVASYALFHELPTGVAEDILRESWRVLAPGGDLLMADVRQYYTMTKYEAWKNDFFNHIHGWDPFWRGYCTTDFGDLARRVGLVDVEWRGLGPKQYPFVLTARKPA